MSEHPRSRAVIRAALIAAALTLSPAASGSTAPVALGRTTLGAETRGAEARDAFRGVVAHELDELALERVRASDRFVLSATLMRLEVASRDDETEATCVVSVTLSRARGGALHAIIRGRARAVDAPSRARDAGLAALTHAVRSAMRQVPEAIRR